MGGDSLLTNATVVTPDECFRGTVEVSGGLIVNVDRGNTALPSAVDMEGDFIIPGVVELHTDNIEKHFTPRPGVGWHARSAAIAHDTQLIGAGITTVFDAVAIGSVSKSGTRLEELQRITNTVVDAQQNKLFRAEHFLHMRCELSYESVLDLFQPFTENERVKLVSLMDHAPGQRQFTDIAKYRQYFQGKYGYTDPEMDDFIRRHTENSRRFSDRHRKHIVKLCKYKHLAMASHDDATPDHVDEALDNGVVISEFPTTDEAAESAHTKGLKVLVGAPNIVCGKSHSGNVSALDLAKQGHIDILSSDYFPSSILHAAFLLKRKVRDISLPMAIRTVTANPARAANLTDRGEIMPGKLGDMVRVKLLDDLPVVREVWRQGNRVY